MALTTVLRITAFKFLAKL